MEATSPLGASASATTASSGLGDAGVSGSGSGAAPPVGRRAASLVGKSPAKKGVNDVKAEGARPAVKKGTRIDIDND